MLTANKNTVENKIKHLLDPECLHCALYSMCSLHHTPGTCIVPPLLAQITMAEIPMVACGGSKKSFWGTTCVTA